MRESYPAAPAPSIPKASIKAPKDCDVNSQSGRGETGTSKHTSDAMIIGKTPRDTAIGMLAAGLWPIPLYPRGVTIPGRDTPAEGKEPIGKAWGLTRNTTDTIARRFREHPKAGIGVGLGPGRGPGGSWLIDIEGDGPEAEQSRTRGYGGEDIKTLSWEAPRGRHDLLAADSDRMAKLVQPLTGLEGKGLKAGVYHLPEFPGLEIRVGGVKADGTVKQIQSAFPPTLGTDGKPRRWNGVATIAPAPESLYQALERAATGKPSPKCSPAPTRSLRGKDFPAGRYAQAALERELDKLEKTAEGKRNHQLNESSFNVGQFIGAGALSRSEVEKILIDTAVRIGLSREESIRTVRSGLEAGIAQPRDLSEVGKPSRSEHKHPPSANGNGRRVDPTADAEDHDDRVDIDITADFHKVVDRSASALASHPNVYQRGDQWVEILRQEQDDPEEQPGIKRKAGAPLIVILNKVTARTLISRLARFWAYDRRDKEWVRKAPPRDVAEAVIGLKRSQGSRELIGIIEAPTLRPDGSLLDEPGYDEETGLLYLPNAVYPRIPEEPSTHDVKAAAAELLKLVTDFPFKEDSDMAAWLALVLTLVARSAIRGPTPGFLFSANVAGSGKTILVSIASQIAFGRSPAYDGYAADDVEMEKRLSAVAIAGDPLLLLDNAANGSAIGGPALDRAIKADGTFRSRMLGKTEMSPNIPWLTVIAATGNNVYTKDDALRRFVPCFLCSLLERPETRNPAEFTITKQTGLSLEKYVMRERPRLVAAVLTILHGYIFAGRPRANLTPMDFEAWETMVRQAIYFATGVDPCGSRESLQANDETTLERRRVVQAWKMLCLTSESNRGFTSRDAAEAVNKSSDTDLKKHFLEAFPKAVNPKVGEVDPAKMGYVLRRCRDVPTPHGILTQEPSKDHSAAVWFVKKV